MNNSIGYEDIKGIFFSVSKEMEANKELLTELDAAIGDGDLGLTMCAGFSKIAETMRGMEETTVGRVLAASGMVMNKTVPSTMGTILSTAMLKMGIFAKDMREVGFEAVVPLCEAGLNGIMGIGKSKPGDKTVLDSLYPALEAFKASLAGGADIAGACAEAYRAAAEGAERTKEMKSVHGRGAWYGEKSIGRQDPGATAGMLIVKGISGWYGSRK